jgi:hypothetical protein
MYLIELAPGTEQLFRSSEALVAAIRSGEVASQMRIFHRATAKWISVTLHPLYQRHAQSPSETADAAEGLVGRDRSEDQPMVSRRDARLRPEFARLYPFLQAGEWESAAVLTDRVVASTLGRPDGMFITGERALDPEHFEFRGSDERQAPHLVLRRDDP